MPNSSEQKRRGYHHVNKNGMTCIIQDIENGERRGRKYRNIPNTARGRFEIERLAREKFPNAFMILCYDHTGNEIDRIKLK